MRARGRGGAAQLPLPHPRFVAHLYFWLLHPHSWHLQDSVVPLGLGQLQCGLPELLPAEISSLNKHHQGLAGPWGHVVQCLWWGQQPLR